MDELQISPKITRMIKAVMAKTICKVKVQNELSKPFDITRGIRQGNGLACILFNLALEKVIRQSGVNRGDTITLKSTQLLAYALLTDYIDIVARSIVDLQESFIRVEKVAREIGFEINEERR